MGNINLNNYPLAHTYYLMVCTFFLFTIPFMCFKFFRWCFFKITGKDQKTQPKQENGQNKESPQTAKGCPYQKEPAQKAKSCPYHTFMAFIGCPVKPKAKKTE